MKHKYLLFAIPLCLIFVFGASAYGQAPDYLESAFSKLGETHDWKSPELGEIVKQAAEHPTTPQRALTAKVLQINYLMSLETKESLAEALTLANGVVQTAPDTWQGALARFSVTSIYDLQGKREQELVTGKAALAGIDFSALEKSKDPHFVKLLGAFGTTPSDIRDGLRMMVAKGYAGENKITEANAVVSEIKDPAIKDAISADIKALVHSREEAGAAAKSKPTPSTKSP